MKFDQKFISIINYYYLLISIIMNYKLWILHFKSFLIIIKKSNNSFYKF